MSPEFGIAYWLTPAGWVHIVAFGALLPVTAIRARRRLLGASEGPPPDRLRHFRSATLSLSLLAACSLAVAWVQAMPLFPHTLPTWRGLLAGLAAYTVAVLFMRPRWRRAVERNRRAAHLFMPSTTRERSWWLAVSVLAGLGEEITWRGVQTGLLTAATGSYPLAGILSAVSFGGAHAAQGWKSAGVIVVFALGFQTLVWFTGSLYVAMGVHVIFDITAGLTYGRLGRELESST